MMREVAGTLATLSQRERFTTPDDLVFSSQLGGHISPKHLGARYRRALDQAGLRRLRFHDLRHTFGTHAIRAADPREVMEWMGHADLKTTQVYLAYRPKADAARRLSAPFDASGAPIAVEHG